MTLRQKQLMILWITVLLLIILVGFDYKETEIGADTFVRVDFYGSTIYRFATLINPENIKRGLPIIKSIGDGNSVLCDIAYNKWKIIIVVVLISNASSITMLDNRGRR